MAEKKDYYNVLGVERNASRDEIRKAYKRLAKENHPDRFQDASDKKAAEEKFKEINEAAAILGDENKRQQYDQFGHVGEGADFSGAGFKDFSGFSDLGGDFDFGDIFDQFFGGGFEGFSRGGRGRRASYAGSDLRMDLSVTLKEVVTGVEKTIVIPRLEKCDTCGGKGAKDSEDITTCDACRGTGRETSVRRTPFGLFQTTTTCRRCGGEGTIIKEPCPECSGSGRVKKSSKLKIRIPAGVESGTRLRISGEGEAGARGDSPGDLYVVIHVLEHPLFKREGNDIYVDVPISFTQAALGSEVEIPTIDGKTKIKIPEGTQTGTIFSIKGKGIPDLSGYGTGVQKAKVTIQTPEKLTKRQKELLKKYAEESGEEPSKSFFDRFRL